MKILLTRLACLFAAWLQPPSDADFARLADQRVQPYVKQNQFSGTVLVARDGKPVFRKAYGMANREWGIANTVDTKFRIGSIAESETLFFLKVVEAELEFEKDGSAKVIGVTVHQNGATPKGIRK